MACRIPKYRCFKPKNLGLVVIGGTQHYLGKYGSPESMEEYNRLIQEWLARGISLPSQTESGNLALTVDQLMLSFLSGHAEIHYRHADGSPTGELANFSDSFRPLKELYGPCPAEDFSPLKLKAVRQKMIQTGLARSTINQRVRRIIHLFKWATENELVPPSVHHGLRAVSGLKRGRSEAREASPVKPVLDDQVAAVEPHVSRQVWAMVVLQRLTGMRPGEVVVMRTCDLDVSTDIWRYVPQRHKTQHHGHKRTIFIGPRAQRILAPWLRTEVTEYLFSPKEAMEEYRREQRRHRKTPLYPSQRGRKRKCISKQVPGDRYTTKTYHHAVQYGCRRASISIWHPNQLRHTAATQLRRKYGLEAASVILGHSNLETTQVYAEADSLEALRVTAEVG
jgi:integrase